MSKTRGGEGVYQLPLYHGGGMTLRVRPRVRWMFQVMIFFSLDGIVFSNREPRTNERQENCSKLHNVNANDTRNHLNNILRTK